MVEIGIGTLVGLGALAGVGALFLVQAFLNAMVAIWREREQARVRRENAERMAPAIEKLTAHVASHETGRGVVRTRAERRRGLREAGK